jgi:folate-binding Fe-S cluster repair protein YgfZ
MKYKRILDRFKLRCKKGKRWFNFRKYRHNSWKDLIFLQKNKPSFSKRLDLFQKIILYRHFSPIKEAKKTLVAQ